MSATLDQIKEPIAAEMREFEKKFRSSMKTKVALLDRIMTYIVRHKGKQIRPLFVFLSAGISGGINEKTYRGASLVELLHTATLIHDDVVDSALERRGFFSINALWKNKIAVLVGDYLLSRGLLHSLENNDFEMLKICSNAVQAMSEGELLQIEKARKLDIEEDVYFDIIRMKTASLIASCCAIGAYSSGISEEKVELMKEFGEKIGIAFQIKDDLFDFGTDDIGKPTLIDIKEKKMTLPLIHALSNGTKSERRRIINTVKSYNTDTKRVGELVQFVKEKGGIDYATNVMYRYRDEAFEILYQFPDNRYRQSLEDLVRFTVERKK